MFTNENFASHKVAILNVSARMYKALVLNNMENSFGKPILIWENTIRLQYFYPCCFSEIIFPKSYDNVYRGKFYKMLFRNEVAYERKVNNNSCGPEPRPHTSADCGRAPGILLPLELCTPGKPS